MAYAQIGMTQVPRVASQTRRRALLALTAPLVLGPVRQSGALGMESVDIPSLETPDVVRQIQERNAAKLAVAEESFQNSELLRSLKERSEANREK